MMEYTGILEKIHALNKFGSRPGLQRVQMLLDMMGNPQNELEFIHVAGTNGKGSVCALVSSVLRCSGYKTGLFISPYITDFCERIQINNLPVSHEELTEVAEHVFSFVEKLNAQDIIITEFEFVTAVGFECFRRAECDVVVLEVGMGGRLDSTNVIKAPLCCAITNISFDHTAILGDTLEQIAVEKCGIIKEGTRVVAAHSYPDTDKVIKETCKEKEVPLWFSSAMPLTVKEQTLEGTLFEYEGLEIRLPLPGGYQVQNLKVALSVLGILQHKFAGITADTIKAGVESAANPARFEVISHNPTVVIDGAHNPDGMLEFSLSVQKYFPHTKGVLIMSMLADKDSKTSLKFIKDSFAHVYTVAINNPRAMDVQQMTELAREYFEDVTPCESVEQALLRAYEKAKELGTHLCVCGSLYLAGEIRPYALKYCKSSQ